MRIFSAPITVFCAAGFLLALGGCNKKSQDAVVVLKEFIPKQIIVPEGAEPPAQHERASLHDQWLVHLEMADHLKARADVEPAQWNALRVGDKVRATYSQGKYTGTVWRVELRKDARAATP